MSPAGTALGLGNLGGTGLGDALTGQVADQTDELRRKRMLEAQQRGLLGPGGSAAATSLFGGGSPLSGLGGTGLVR
jgi:hypothetical protein